MKHLKITLLGLLILATSCQKLQPNENTKNKNFSVEVIYGKDDRIDFFDITDPHWLALAQSSVALFDHRKITVSEDGLSFNITADEYGKNYHLCPDEKFYKQPSSSFCSGFLIGPDIVVTAGHCIRNQYNCETVRLVFGYFYDDFNDSPLTLPSENLYECSELIHSETNGVSGSDYAIMKLDRPVKGFQPLQLRTSGRVDNNDELTVIGYPSGLPGKLAHGGIVRDNRNENYFVTTLDTYGGNSGSAVFNRSTRLIEGILVRGDTDFVYDQESQCRRSNVCQSTSCRGEDVVRIDRVLRHLTPADLQSRAIEL